MRMAKKFVASDFHENTQFDRSRQALQHIKNLDRHVSRKKSYGPSKNSEIKYCDFYRFSEKSLRAKIANFFF